MGHFSNDAFEKFTYHFSVFIGERLRLLLETKHLYQKLSILPKEIHAQLREKIIAVSEKEDFDSRVKEFISGQFAITDKQLFHEPGHIPLLCLIISNVKLFCSECVTREAFRPIWFSDITKELLEQNLKQKTLEHLQQSLKQARFKVAFGNTFQVFYLVYQCQEGTPEVFLVKRNGLDLTIEGRSPIEHIEIPNYIPNDERHWFRDAVIAFQTGKILAALFYLRTFIEQFARRKTNTKDQKKTGEEILSAYAETLPANLRDTMPSLREWYDKLSEALHGAKEDPELFETARERVEKHFDIRRVHDPDSKAVSFDRKETKKR